MFRNARCLAVLVTAAALLGAGPIDPRESMGLVSLVTNLAVSAHPSATAPGGGVRSFRATFVAKDETFTVIYDEARHAEKFAIPGTGRTSMYVVWLTMYMQARDGTWSKLDLSRLPGAPPKPHASDTSGTAGSLIAREKSDPLVHALPDRRVDGVLMGVIAETIPAGRLHGKTHTSKPVTITCAYEKVTERLRICDAPPLFTARFDRYNDPANRVVVPTEALNARELPFPPK
jgi:hypothetical protein